MSTTPPNSATDELFPPVEPVVPPPPIRISASGGQLIVGGEVDALTAPDLQVAIDATIDELVESPDHVELDLSDVTFMDSSGLRVILACSARAREENRDLVLVRPSPSVVRLFELTQVIDHLTIRD